MKTFVLAEMGSSWLIGKQPRQHFEFALKLIGEAAKCGANGVKTQWVSDPLKMCRRRKLKDLAACRGLAWPVVWHAVFAEEAHRLGLEYVVSAYIPEDVPTLLPFVDMFKVASLEARSRSLWQTLAGRGKPVYASFGCMGKNELDGIVGYAYSCGMTAMLHCVAAYPAPLAEVNLALIKPDLFDGISDHSAYPLTGAFAVMRGARVVEVHCRLDETRKDNPDFNHSLAPVRLREYIDNIRIAEKMLGDGEKRIMPSEKELVSHRVTR